MWSIRLYLIMNVRYGPLVNQSLDFEYIVGAVSGILPGLITQWHNLPSSALSHVSDGDWKVEREDMPPFIVHAGEAFYMPTGIRHQLTMVTQGVTVSRWAHFNIFAGGYLSVCALFDIPNRFEAPVSKRMGEILEILASRPEQEDWPFSTIERKRLEFELADLLLRGSSPKYEGEVRLQNLQRILPALNAVQKDIAADFTRDILAAHVCLSASRFASIFKETLGMTPIDYVTKMRMQRAQQMLVHTHQPIDRIAAEIGYHDARYFSRLFKRHYGSSPQQYRAMVPKN